VMQALQSLKGEPEPKEPEIAAAGEVDDAAKAERPRNERGQFVAKEPEPAPELKVPDAGPATATVETPSQAIEAPKGWSAEAKAEFGKLSPAVQQAVLKRESEIDAGGARWSEEKRTLLSHFEPVRAISERHKVHPAEAIKRLAAATDFLDSDPEGFIRWVVKDRGIDLAKLAATPATEQPQRPQADPVVAQVLSEINSLKSRFEQQDQASVLSEIDRFRASLPENNHFDQVRVKMGQLMAINAQMGEPMTLQEAYDQAVWALPDIRNQLLASQNATAEAARKAREQADKAKRGAISINGGPSTASVPNPKRDYDTVEDAARAAWAQHVSH